MSVMFARLSAADGRSWLGPAADSREGGDAPGLSTGGRAERDVPRSAEPLSGGRMSRRGHSLFGLRNRRK
jgi:hypothetical protein